MKKKRVAEGIYERNGTYQVAVYDGYERRTIWLSGIGSLAEAREIRTQEKQQRKRRSKGQSAETADQFARRWVRDYGQTRSLETNNHNRERISKFGEDFKGVKLADISRSEAREWATQNTARHKTVQAALNDLVRDGILQENPFARLKLPQPKGRQGKDIILPEEVKELTETARDYYGEGYGDVFGSLVAAAAWSGLRPGELFALRHEDVDYEQGLIRVRRSMRQKTQRIGPPKSGKHRDVGLLPPAEHAFRTMRRKDVLGDGTIFYTKRHKPYTGRNHFYYWQPVRAAFWANLPKHRQEALTPNFDWYELRHFFGSQLGRLNVSPYDIANQMGHQDGGRLAMRLYIHTESSEARDRIRAAYDKAS